MPPPPTLPIFSLVLQLYPLWKGGLLWVVTLPQFERKQAQLHAALEAAVAHLAPHFPNPAARATAAAYLKSLLA